ncbi:hypothetical membrane protein [Corynebacterium imitans]|uniref:Hypothetical membrane protein n=1 Tax=Corynebacterium imitans TaxID=156978 RepID=A0A076NNG0_9CORY|nr:hypothetical protein [Corynebacterium imitans]AIJ33796.1 hypothetical protein CIMIT_07670 [Corynebacterium imitans]SNV75390.1 hypothetical membrane protein [Corynebacterium imitans]
MRNFRTAAVATATALTVALGGVTVATAETTDGETSTESTYTPHPSRPKEETKNNDSSVAFKGFDGRKGDKEFGESIKDGVKGSFDGKGSSHYVNDADKPFYGVDAFGKEKDAEAMPQWARIWYDGTIVAGIGALVGLIIAGFNFASYNGLIKL